MKILSIDVGIKNLALCLLEYNSIDYEIVYWDVVDICSMKEAPTCGIDTCKKSAKYYISDISSIDSEETVNIKTEPVYFCTVHAKKSEYIIPSREISISKVSKMKKKELETHCNKFKLDTEQCKVKADYLVILKTYLKTHCLESYKAPSANNMTLVDIGRNLQLSFDALFSDISIETVIIENQISPIANRMKTLQGMISQYFIMNNVKTIEFISAHNKLKKFVTGKTTYNERKKLGISTMNTILEKKHIKWKNQFQKHKKKDDLADAYLQGLWYIDEVLSKHQTEE